MDDPRGGVVFLKAACSAKQTPSLSIKDCASTNTMRKQPIDRENYKVDGNFGLSVIHKLSKM